LLARVHLRRLAPGGRLALRAIEIVPIRDMHRQPAAVADPDQARRRVEVVNVLSARLEDATAPASGNALFAARPDGSGLYCVDGAASDPDAVGQLCRGWTAPPLPAAAEQAEIMHACTRPLPAVARGKSGKGGKAKASGKAKTARARVGAR
jgi:hypothetical protein